MYDSIGTYRAKVLSTADPTNTGKIKVQCPQVAGLAELNWAEPANFADPVPNVGDLVWVFFSGGDTTKPVYTLSKNPYTWQTPAYLTGWSSNNQFNGLGGPPLMYRKTMDDEVYLYGNAKVSNTSNFVFTLPIGFYNPNGAGMSGFAFKNVSGTVTPIGLAVDVSNGNVILATVPAAGNEFLFNVKIPMLLKP